MTDWHRYVGAGGENRVIGKAITGACNLAFLFVAVSGVYLWWPRSWRWRNLKTITLFRGGLRGKAREWNWHNVFGFWSAVPLVLVVASATVISYVWASNLVFRAVGEEPMTRGPGPGPGGGPPPGPGGGFGSAPGTTAPSLDNLDALLTTAMQQDPNWTTITLQLPTGPDAPVSFSLDTGMGGEPHKRSTLRLDPSSGTIVEHSTFWDGTSGQKARSWLRFIHTGEAGGFWGQTVAGLASAGGVFLVYTGFALTIRRFCAWRKRRRSRAVEEVEVPVRRTA